MPLSFLGTVDERLPEEPVDRAGVKLLGRGAEFAVCGAAVICCSASRDWLLSWPRRWVWDLRAAQEQTSENEGC